MVKVKICGITNLEDALLASEEGADALGFIFSPKSPRFLTKPAAQKIIKQLDPFLTKVGVFLDEEKEKVQELASGLKLDVLQFHGKESPLYCNFFKSKFKVVKVFFPEDKPYDKKISRYNVDAYMFDVLYESKVKGEKTLSPDTLGQIGNLIKSNKRVIISGGLNINNIDKIKKIKPYAVDVASGIEKLVGKKDKDLVKEFIKRAKK